MEGDGGVTGAWTLEDGVGTDGNWKLGTGIGIWKLETGNRKCYRPYELRPRSEDEEKHLGILHLHW